MPSYFSSAPWTRPLTGAGSCSARRPPARLRAVLERSQARLACGQCYRPGLQAEWAVPPRALTSAAGQTDPSAGGSGRLRLLNVTGIYMVIYMDRSRGGGGLDHLRLAP